MNRAITWEQARELAQEQRAAQGLPPDIEDVAVLTRIATIMRSVEPATLPDTRRRKRRP